MAFYVKDGTEFDMFVYISEQEDFNEFNVSYLYVCCNT